MSLNSRHRRGGAGLLARRVLVWTLIAVLSFLTARRANRWLRSQGDLVIAIQTDNVEMADDALRWGADPNDADYNQPRLTLAASIRRLLASMRHGQNAEALYARFMWPQVGAPASRGDIHDARLLKILLASGADPNAFDNEMVTPLMHVSRNNENESVAALIRFGADVRRKDRLGRGALTYSAEAGNTEAIRMLVARHADVNEADYYGQTPIFSAACSGNLAAVTTLLSAGANANHADRWGLTALDWAAVNQRRNVISSLRLAGGVGGKTSHPPTRAPVW